ncbi:asparaginyl-tRNA synthetase [Kitasatospora sp. GAS204A]|uniref:asparagine synthetase A n=1 Tax=unclassified Kitasatospora TaxID=2633591 RepID=UPI002476E1B2|nr:asparagine synthetase A [Kitasatospora sp. GAS204B]MDH6122946.1 asparaginyl-tRNA synthetase [Kitasatospora sp. GAS204B]
MTTQIDRPLSTAMPVPDADILPLPRLHLADPRTRATLRIQQALLAGAREHLRAGGSVEMAHPIIGPVTDPGSRGAKQADIDFYGHHYKLMTSAILYKQASLLTFDRIFLVAPNVRLEPIETSSTRRHLAEFRQIDVEVARATRDEAMDLVEGVIRHAVTKVLAECAEELAALERDTAALQAFVAAPFARIPHGEVVERLRAKGYPQAAGTEIEWQAEELISRDAAAPFFVVGYPKGSRGFYDKESTEDPGTLLNFDLIAPEGCGELCSGSEREFEYAKIITRMRETGENPAKYAWYLDVVRNGIPNSAGFGIGVERLTRWVAGLDSVWQATAFPKLAGVVSP